MNEKPIILDPDNIPVRVVNGVAAGGVIGVCIDATLATSRFSISTGSAEQIVVARLRFDLEMAVKLQDFLARQIDLLKNPPALSRPRPN